MPKILLVAGEASADLYGARLITALQEQSKEPIHISGLGGPQMRRAGMEILVDLTTEAGTGLAPLKRLGLFARTFRQLVSYARETRPDLALLIDLPDFNLRLAKELKRLKIPVVYYISPQIWAWRPGRIKTIARTVTKMLVIFEFEKSLYEKHGVPVAFVGHPLMDIIKEKDGRGKTREGKEGLVIGLLPGSRKSELSKHFPLMLKSAEFIQQALPQTEFRLACAPQITAPLVNKYLAKSRIKIQPYFNRTYEVMQTSDLLITASGTATVEAAIFGTPMVVIYKVSALTASLFGPLIKTPYYAMVNIIAGKAVAPELMQSDATPEKIAREVTRLVEEKRLPVMAQELRQVRVKLGAPGASRRAAEEIIRLLKTT